VPFIQEGEDFMRSKYDDSTGKYDGNSYISGDFVNAMDYSLKVKHLDTFEKVKELIALRNVTDQLRLSSRSEIKEKLKDAAFDNGIIRFTVGGLKVVHTVNGGALPLDGTYEILYSNVRSEYGEVSNEISLLTNESVVLKKVN
jgi:pullulanase